MTTRFDLLSDLRVGSYYNLIKFNHGIRMTEFQLRETSRKNIKSCQNLGKLLQIRQYGRPYDPDVILHFEDEKGQEYEIDPTLGSSEAYVEYEPDTEEMSKARIVKRTKILEQEIQGNDWALRPENVVMTQGIDLSGWA
jgi:hypothetical protein